MMRVMDAPAARLQNVTVLLSQADPVTNPTWPEWMKRRRRPLARRTGLGRSDAGISLLMLCRISANCSDFTSLARLSTVSRKK